MGQGRGLRQLQPRHGAHVRFQRSPLSGYWTRLGNTIFTRGSRFYNFQGLRRYKEKFSPDWEPRYLLCTSKLVLPRVLTNLISLISRGPFGLIKNRSRP